MMFTIDAMRRFTSGKRWISLSAGQGLNREGADTLILRLIAIALLVMSGLVSTHAADVDPPVRPQILVDAKTGEVLFSQNAFQRWAPASITKLMTTYVTFHALKQQLIAMNSPVRVSEYALQQPPTKMGFPIGTIVTIDTAIKIIMVKSANDIALAVGEAVGGSEEQFVALMNAHARRLGMKDTNFVNPHGLHDPAQYTTARDFALLAMAITRDFPQHDGYFNIPAIKVGRRRLRNHNAMLERFDGTTGMKTGYVCASGYNVVVRTQREGRELIAVVLGGKSGLQRSVRAAKMLHEGFENLYPVQAASLADLKPLASDPKHIGDITRETCPRQYRAQTRAKRKAKTVIDLSNKTIAAAIIPTPSPGFTPPSGSSKTKAEKAKPLSIGKMEKLYLSPRKRVGEDVRIRLGGGLGPNPHGLRHTDGGPAKPVLPVPQKRPG